MRYFRKIVMVKEVTDAVNRQTELLMESNWDYQAALMTGDLNKVGAIGNMLRSQVQNAVNDAMVYLWREV